MALTDGTWIELAEWDTAYINDLPDSSFAVIETGGEKDEKFWNAVVRQTLIERLLLKDIDNYGLLKVSPEGTKFLKKPVIFGRKNVTITNTVIMPTTSTSMG